MIPNDIEAEQSVLGSCLVDLNAVTSAVETLTEEDFYRKDHKIIFKGINNLFSKNEPIDIITLKDEISSMGQYEQVGGIEYIANLPEKVPTTANVNKYITIVKQKAIARNLINISNEISILAFDTTTDIDELIAITEKKIFEITQKKNAKGVSKLKDLLVDSITNLENLYNNGNKKGISTGFVDIDRRMGGLRGSELIIVAARPAMGKSAFVLNIATHVAYKEKIPVLIFNLEMGKEQLTDRIICSQAYIDSKKYQDGKLDEEDWSKIAESIGPLSEANILIDDNSSITISEIRAKCMKMKMEENIGLVIIDYLQLINPSSNKMSREQEVAEISRSLKLLSKDLNIPVIALSQLSRANEKRGSEDKRPVLSDLRDSGSIEQDADIVLFIHREEYYNLTEENKGIAEINFAKFRRGQPGTEKLLWLGEYTKFVNMNKY